jgi:predicted MPP superfamily phosphohydrolase/CheY-like chemotaxis protein
MSRGTILLIDDQEQWYQVVADILQDEGYTVEWARDRAGARERLEADVEGKIDIVSVNLNLKSDSPFLDGIGYRMLEELQQRWPDLPRIAISALHDQNARYKIVDLYDKYKVKHVAIKPLEDQGDFSERLLHAVADILRTRSAPTAISTASNHILESSNTKVFSWLHLSDLHIGCKEPNRDWNDLSRVLLNDIELHQQPANRQPPNCAGVILHPDLILITGDIAYRATESEYKRAEAFLHELWKITGLGSTRTFIVPGNHDVNRAAVQNDPMYKAAYERLSHTTADRKEWLAALNEWWPYPALRSMVEEKFSNYTQFASRNSAPLSQALYYSQVVEVRGIKIGFLGLNSAYISCKDGEDRGRDLWIGKPQLDEIEQALPKDVQLRLALIHHPHESLHEHDDAWDRLEEICSFILHGHMHRLSALVMGQPGQEHICLPGGSVHEGDIWQSQRYSFGQFDLDNGQLDLYLRMTTPRTYTSYIKDNQTYPMAAADGHLRMSLPKKITHEQ